MKPFRACPFFLLALVLMTPGLAGAAVADAALDLLDVDPRGLDTLDRRLLNVVVDSVPGRGTNFRVLFPVHSGETPAYAHVRLPATGSERLSGRILLVDDEPSVLTVMQQTLESWGLEVEAASSADAAERAAFHLKAAEDYLESAERALNEHAYSEARRDAKQAKMKALDALKATESSPDNN